MSNDLSNYSPAISRVLILSLSNFESPIERSFLFEFEYAVCDFDGVDVFAPDFPSTIRNKITKEISRFVFNTMGKTLPISPIFNQFFLDREYDLFLFICQDPTELYYLDSIKNWRKKCRKAVCWLNKLDINNFNPQLTALKDFDRVFIGRSCSPEIAKSIQVSCSYMPPGIDAIKFCPYPIQPQRTIDICCIGRRPDAIHESLLNLAHQNNLFYMYDTMKESPVSNHREYRSLYRNLVKRSRYLIACKPEIESQTNGQEELNVCFFEGAAGGAVMLGSLPSCDAFSQNFDWSDAVIPLNKNLTNIAEIITQIDSQPERLHKISTDNVVNSLLRHDWVYRWEKILDSVDISPSVIMLERKAKLKELAEIVAANNPSIK